jgi:hypothetical protein
MFILDPEVYRQYRDQVLALCNSFQRIGQRGLSDREIAERLGLEERVVTEIRCVAERDLYGLDEWQRAIEFKRRAAREWQAAALKRPDLKEP